MSLSVESIGRGRRELGAELVDDRSGRGEAVGLDPLPDRVAVRRLDLRSEIGVEPLRLAGLGAELLLRLAEPLDLAVGEVERLEEQRLGHLVGAGLDHREAVLRADDDEVERGLLPVLRHRRVDDELAVDEPDPHCADRPEERERREHERRGGAVDAKDVVRHDHVRAEDGADDLHLVAEALRPQRPDRAVDHARREGGALAGASLALEEAAGDLARGVHPLFDVDRQREEVGAFAGLRASHCGGENHRLASANDDSAVRLLRELAGFEADLILSNLDGDLRPAFGRDTHKLSSTVLVEGGSSSQAVGRGGLARTSTLLIMELTAQAELLDEGAIALKIFLLQVVQEAATSSDELEEPAPGRVVLLVRAEMLSQLVDALREHRDLHLGVPVSAALRPCFVMSSCFASLVRAICPLLSFASRGSARAAKDVTRAGPGSRLG